MTLRMELKNLFSGIAVVIDDEVNISNPKNGIGNIVQQIKSQNIPILTYEELPLDETIKHFQNLSFLLLDWRLNPPNKNINAGVILPDHIAEYDENENISFLCKFRDICFCPIFIFTNEDTEVIESKLEEEGLYKKGCLNHIFVKSKDELRGTKKFLNEVISWIEKNSSIYVLKKWEQAYRISKNKLFLEFQELSPIWPKIMWKNYGDDGVNKSLELGEFISKNMHTRMAPLRFSDKILNKRGRIVSPEEIKKVIEGERFLKKDKLEADNICSGDIFKISKKYYINIRASCDLIPGRGADGSVDDVDLYLLQGSQLSEANTKKMYNRKYGSFQEIDSQSIVFPLNENKVIDFRFKKLKIKKWKEIKEKRIGRLLPPFINKIQQKYALYIQRQGLPRIPKEAIS